MTSTHKIIGTRETKWKAWDTEKNKWFEPTYEAYKGKLEELLMSPSGDLSLRTMEGMAHESTFPNRFIKVFSTGIKDKNGKEIHEGDIVMVNLYHVTNLVDDDGCFINLPVVFVDGCFCALYEIENYCRHKIIGLSDYVVIGNVFENPNLLK